MRLSYAALSTTDIINGGLQTMKPLSRKRLPATLVALLVALPLSTAAAAYTDEAVWQPVPDGQGNGLFYNNHDVPPGYDPLLLVLGRSVYADLQRARQAALDRQATNLMVAIKEAEDTIHRLQRPPEMLALDAQLRVIRNDLNDRSKSMDKGLWVPVEAAIDEVLVYEPDDIKRQTHEAVRKAQSSIAEGDRSRVAEQLDVVTTSLQYRLGIFPLNKVEQDLQSARASTDRSEPDWIGALEAVQSALSTFHWFTHEPAQGLLSAYNDVINAYITAVGTDSRPEQKRSVTRYLVSAERRLAAEPGGKQLASEASKLAQMTAPPGADMKTLIENIRSEIHLQQLNAERRYWESHKHNEVE
jgi:hypothetical protein